MDSDTVANHIQGLSKHKFDLVAGMVLSKLFGYLAVNTDGKGDSGFDSTVLKDSGGTRAIAVQRTVQDQRWRPKALEDADKASKDGALKFFFLTSRIRESSELRQLENDVTTKYHVAATCLCGREIADLIIQRGLLFEWAQLIGLPLDVPHANRPTSAEQMLHSYIALGTDRSSLRDEIYDDTILMAAMELGATSDRDTLATKACDIIQLPDIRREQLENRIDSLLTRGFLIRGKEANTIQLSDGARSQLKVSDGIFTREMEDLAAAQNDFLYEKFGLSLNSEESSVAAALIAKWFVHHQIARMERLSPALAQVGIAKDFGDPEQNLRELLKSADVPVRHISTALEAFVEMARDTPVVKKLVRAATFVTLESGDSAAAVRLLGAKSWAHVFVILDASVAIPFICAELFGATNGRFSRGVVECIRLLRKVNANMRIPWFYINEAASHLLRARNYAATIEDFVNDLAFSENAFVAHYCQLRRTGGRVPDSLAEFLRIFSPAIGRPDSDIREWTRSIMNDLQPLFREHGVEFEHLDSRIPESFTKDAEVGYMHKLKELNRTKPFQLIDHDVKILAHLRQKVARANEVYGCLTWDGAMIGISRELGDCGWVVSPVDAADFIQPQMTLSEGRLCSLAHTLARARETPSEAAAHMIDRLVSLAGQNLQEWEFRQRIKAFRDEALARIDLTNSRYFNQIDDEVALFLKKEGIQPTKDTGPEIDA